MGKYQEAWDQVELSREADDRIRRSIIEAQHDQNKVIALHKEERNMRTAKKISRTALVAAVMVLVLSVTALAVGIGRIVFIEEDTLVIQAGEDEPTEYVEIGFGSTADGPVHMGVWTLDVPDGFEETDGSYYRDGDAGIYWENADGARIVFEYQAADLSYNQMRIAQQNILEKQDVTVNGAPGHIYTYTNDFGNLWTALFWTEEEKGVGFRLLCDDDTIDLLALAQTTHQTDDKPAPNADTLEAIAEFGDWAPTALPDGYSEYISNGMPSKYGGEGGYGYVYRTYVNDAGYAIHLNYEIPLPGTDYTNYVDAFREPQDLDPAESAYHGWTVTDITVQGQPAGLVLQADGTPFRLAWFSEDGSLVFMMDAEGLTGDELLAVAESVALQ